MAIQRTRSLQQHTHHLNTIFGRHVKWGVLRTSFEYCSFLVERQEACAVPRQTFPTEHLQQARTTIEKKIRREYVKCVTLNVWPGRISFSAPNVGAAIDSFSSEVGIIFLFYFHIVELRAKINK